MTNEEERVRKGYEVHGRVQGVGFRWSTARTARDLGIGGTVRNRSDGAVEVHAEGTPEELGELEAWLREGPRAARVERVEEIPAQGDLPSRFQIVR